MVRLHICGRMKLRRLRLVLVLSAGLCVLSFMHYYKALHQLPLMKGLPQLPLLQLPARGPTGRLTPLALFNRLLNGGHKTSATPGVKGQAFMVWRPEGGKRKENTEEKKNTEDAETYPQFKPRPLAPMGDLHLRPFDLRDEDAATYFAHTKSGGVCFRKGTRTKKDSLEEASSNDGKRALLSVQLEHNNLGTTGAWNASGKLPLKRSVKCKCLQGWHGDHCGIPTIVQHSNLPTKSRLTPRKVPRRVINAINVNHEVDLLHARFHELSSAVDVFIVCESNYTAYGAPRRLLFYEHLANGTFDYVRHKLLYVFLDHFPAGGRRDGWIADDYLRTYLSKDGLSRMRGMRADDVFVINDADEIPAAEGLLFLKLHDGWTEPLGLHLRKSIYGFFWRQMGTLNVLSGCTVGMLFAVYRGNGILLRRRDYYNMPGFRQYEADTGRVLVPWSLGSPVHYAGWHCSWCFRPDGIYYKLVSAQNGDFPRWGDFVEKRRMSYIKRLIRTGGWFDGSVANYPMADPKEHMFAPKYFLESYDKYEYLLRNLYTEEQD